jgi:lysozyme
MAPDMLGLGAHEGEVLEAIKSSPREQLMLGASTDEVLKFITEFEGYLRRLNDGTDRVKPYLCPAGIPTIGYGSIWRMDGSRVAMTDPPIDKAEATALFMRELILKCVPAVNRLIVVRLHALSRGSLISFTFNCGSGALKASNLRKKINAEAWGEVAPEFMKWRIGGGRVLPGLVRRRQGEAQMFLRGVNAQRAMRNASHDDAWTSLVEKAA